MVTAVTFELLWPPVRNMFHVAPERLLQSDWCIVVDVMLFVVGRYVRFVLVVWWCLCGYVCSGKRPGETTTGLGSPSPPPRYNQHNWRGPLFVCVVVSVRKSPGPATQL